MKKRYVLYDELLSAAERNRFYALFRKHRHERRERIQQFSSDFQEQVRQRFHRSKRLLIGDDEHGWDDNGIFNFEADVMQK